VVDIAQRFITALGACEVIEREHSTCGMAIVCATRERRHERDVPIDEVELNAIRGKSLLRS
jgi:hypothetical protein